MCTRNHKISLTHCPSFQGWVPECLILCLFVCLFVCTLLAQFVGSGFPSFLCIYIHVCSVLHLYTTLVYIYMYVHCTFTRITLYERVSLCVLLVVCVEKVSCGAVYYGSVTAVIVPSMELLLHLA